MSRGSNKLPRGSNVSTPVISGHRDVTFTACPGDRAYDLLPDWRRRVHPLVTERVDNRAFSQPSAVPSRLRSVSVYDVPSMVRPFLIDESASAFRPARRIG